MDNQVSSSNAKTLASFETVYKENVLSKPQNIKVFVTEDGIYGTAFICDQIGTKEDDMFYSSFECSFDIITKVYINLNNKLQPVYVQCADHSTGVMNQRRIILPGFNNKEEIIKAIEDGKEKFDNRPEKQTATVDNQAAIYSEKKLAYFETVYRENMLSKPQDITITVTPQHVYGKGFICIRTGINEGDPVYKGFTCSFDEITKIYINNSNKIAPIYIQCGDDNTNGKTSRRIILPKFEESDKEKIVQAVNDAKAEYDAKLEQKRELENGRKLKDIEARRRAQNDEFESMTSGYKDMIKPQSQPAHAPKPVPAPAPEPKPAPAPAPAPKPAPAPAPAPKPAPAPAPAPKPEPAPAPAPKPEPAPAPAPKKDSVTVEDILGLDDILGIRADDIVPAASFMDEISEEPNEEEINSMPVETIQKNPDKIEELVVPTLDNDYELEEVREKQASSEIEELDPSKEIAKKLAPKPAPAPASEPAPAPKPEPVHVPEHSAEAAAEEKTAMPAEPVSSPAESITANAENMSLEDFETAVKKLKSMLDNGVISESEFAVEKKKLFKLLY
ncbi:MAG: SHOCT domain-containing protein [Oscillospiraceae bacterium]|nr:SHOCT domain-containing protein [Oscillospiraceae bacterium]